MSYYSILPSNRVGNAPGTVGFTGQNPDPMRPLQMPGGGFRTRDVNPNELSGNQLASLLDRGGPLAQRAEARARAGAASRGLSNSSMAEGAAYGALIDAATPLAMQQAGAYTNVGDRNMSAENEYLLAEGGWNNARSIAEMNAAVAEGSTEASRENAALAREENRRQFDIEQQARQQALAEDTRRYDVDYQRSIEEQNRTNNLNRNNFISSGIFNTIMGNPEIWRDPQAATGFANYYTQNFTNLWDSLFGGSSAPAAP